MDLISVTILVFSVLVIAQSLFGLYMTLYAWEHPEILEVGPRPAKFLLPKHSFTALLPARHEEAVIYETVRRIASVRYPKHLREIIVICHVDDLGTISEARRAQWDLGDRNIRVLTFRDDPINKPHGLNVGLAAARRQFVTVFDAEDDVHPDLFRLVNTILVQDGVKVVQAGVQLMNYRDRWFSFHNCLEYFFWFKSRLQFHSRVGMVPLGGNTVFFRRDLLMQAGGWDANCLTEDADIGIRLSAMGEPIRVVYDAEFVTREETPDSASSWIRQRTRWNQGFIYLLRKGSWLLLPTLGQRLLALYTFSYSMIQAVLFLLWPTVVVGALLVEVPIPVALVSFIPLYLLFFQLIVQLIGAVNFAAEYRLKLSPLTVLKLAVTFLPYQWMLGISALRAVYRELEIQLGWEKTPHGGAHRRDRPATAPLRPKAIDILNTIGRVPAPVRPAAVKARNPDVRYCVRCGRPRPWGMPTCAECGSPSVTSS